MLVEVDRKLLLKSLRPMMVIAKTRSEVIIYASVNLTVDGDHLVVTACDNLVQLKTTLEANVVESGDLYGGIAVPAKKLAKVLRSSKHETVYLSVKQCALEVIFPNVRYSMAGFLAKDFPVVGSAADGDYVKLDYSRFAEMVTSCMAFMSGNSDVYNLQKCKVSFDSAEVKVESTDGHRLHTVESSCVLMGGESEEFFLQLGVMKIISMVKYDDGSMLISHNDDVYTLMFGQHEISYVKTDVTFPDISKVTAAIEEKLKGQCFHASGEELCKAIKSIYAVDRGRENLVTVGLSEGNINISSGITGDVTADVDVDCDYAGDSYGASFDYDYLLDAISHAGEGRVLIHMGADLDPFVIDSLDGEYAINKSIVMPVRV